MDFQHVLAHVDAILSVSPSAGRRLPSGQGPPGQQGYARVEAAGGAGWGGGLSERDVFERGSRGPHSRATSSPAYSYVSSSPSALPPLPSESEVAAALRSGERVLRPPPSPVGVKAHHRTHDNQWPQQQRPSLLPPPPPPPQQTLFSSSSHAGPVLPSTLCPAAVQALAAALPPRLLAYGSSAEIASALRPLLLLQQQQQQQEHDQFHQQQHQTHLHANRSPSSPPPSLWPRAAVEGVASRAAGSPNPTAACPLPMSPVPTSSATAAADPLLGLASPRTVRQATETPIRHHHQHHYQVGQGALHHKHTPLSSMLPVPTGGHPPLPSSSSSPRWSLADFDIGQRLGEGRFGKIYLARERRTRAAVALKCISKDIVAKTDMMHQIVREVDLHALCSSPRLVPDPTVAACARLVSIIGSGSSGGGNREGSHNLYASGGSGGAGAGAIQEGCGDDPTSHSGSGHSGDDDPRRNILQLHALFWDESAIYLVEELADGGDAARYRRTGGLAGSAAGRSVDGAINNSHSHNSSGHLHEDEARIIVRGVASALAHLHANRIVHRDVKTENILLKTKRAFRGPPPPQAGGGGGSSSTSIAAISRYRDRAVAFTSHEATTTTAGGGGGLSGGGGPSIAIAAAFPFDVKLADFTWAVVLGAPPRGTSYMAQSSFHHTAAGAGGSSSTPAAATTSWGAPSSPAAMRPTATATHCTSWMRASSPSPPGSGYADDPNPLLRRQTLCGTLDYLAPELVRGAEYDYAVDVWALGVVAFELLTGLTPFEAPSPQATCHNIARGQVVFPSAMAMGLGQERSMDGEGTAGGGTSGGGLSETARAFITALLQPDPAARPTAAEALRHPWLLQAPFQSPSPNAAAGAGKGNMASGGAVGAASSSLSFPPPPNYSGHSTSSSSAQSASTGQGNASSRLQGHMPLFSGGSSGGGAGTSSSSGAVDVSESTLCGPSAIHMSSSGHHGQQHPFYQQPQPHNLASMGGPSAAVLAAVVSRHSAASATASFTTGTNTPPDISAIAGGPFHHHNNAPFSPGPADVRGVQRALNMSDDGDDDDGNDGGSGGVRTGPAVGAGGSDKGHSLGATAAYPRDHNTGSSGGGGRHAVAAEDSTSADSSLANLSGVSPIRLTTLAGTPVAAAASAAHSRVAVNATVSSPGTHSSSPSASRSTVTGHDASGRDPPSISSHNHMHQQQDSAVSMSAATAPSSSPSLNAAAASPQTHEGNISDNGATATDGQTLGSPATAGVATASSASSPTASSRAPSSSPSSSFHSFTSD